jgi:hypothetical protein
MVFADNPETFITTPEEIRTKIHKGEKKRHISYWLEQQQYEMFKDKWNEIGRGF